MGAYTVLFPDEKYPVDYDPAIPDFEDFNPMLGELINLSEASLGETSSTEVFFDLSNGLVLKLTGAGFEFDDEDVASDGKITKLELFQGDGTTAVSRLTLSKLSLVDFMEASEIFGDGWGLQSWLLNRADTLNGSNGNDDLFGFGGNDVISGKGGDDFMEGGEGKDKYDGGTGWDLISFIDSKNNPDAFGGISIDFGKLKVTDPYGNVETFKNVEGVRGTQWRDIMKGSGNDEELVGFGGRDIIDGKGGIDAVRYHRDERQGGSNGVFVDLGAGFAIDGFGKRDTLSNIEQVQGTAFDDEIRGNSVANYLRGDDGDDTLAGGLGNDELQGGSGADVFVFDTALNAVTNVDQINDFNEFEDVFHLDLGIFTALAGEGTLSADEFTANEGGNATTADQRIIYDELSGDVFYDADGSSAGARRLFATIEAGLSLTEDNFIVI